MRNQPSLFALFFFAALGPFSVQAEENTLAALGWFEGEWVGVGREGEGGEVAGEARRYISPATEGALSATFQWRNPEDSHIHYAFTVFQETDEGVTGRGIHHGRDFKTFEDNPWKFKAVGLTSTTAAFECVANCRARRVVFSLLQNGDLEERWTPLKNDDPEFLVHYTSVNRTGNEQ